MTVVHSREMTITHKEFLRLLPKALNGRHFTKNGNQIVIDDEGILLHINLSKESVRNIASLSLPTTAVKIELIDMQEKDASKFMARFDLAYHKGGG